MELKKNKKYIIIADVNIEIFEKKIVEAQEKYEIISSDFGRIKNVLWIRMYVEES